MIPEPEELIRLQLALECKGPDANGLLVRIPGPSPDDIDRYCVYRHAGGYVSFLRYDVPSAIREQVIAFGPDRAFDDPAVVQQVLSQDAACTTTRFFKSYVFPAGPTVSADAGVARLDESHRAMAAQYDPKLDIGNVAVFAIVVDGQVVSSCQSSRENDSAGEAWVRTRPSFRRRGFARRVTAAWAHHLRQQGKIAFYSHDVENRASEAVARSLGLVQFATLAAWP